MLGIWWPTLIHDATSYVKTCDECHKFKKPMRFDNMPMHPLMGARVFVKWGIDFVGPIDPLSCRTQSQHIIVAMDYLTKWVEAKARIHNNA